MTVGIARLAFIVPDSRSLKDKRVVLRRVKDRVRAKFNAAVAEVGEDNDLWQRAALGVAVIGNDRGFVSGALDEIVRFVRGEVEVTNVEREVQTYNDALADNDLDLLARS